MVLLTPLEEFLIKSRIARSSSTEIGAADKRSAGVRLPTHHRGEHFFGHRIPIPSGHACGEIDLFPLRMKRRLRQFVEALEKVMDKSFDPTVAIARLGPVVNGQND